MKPLQLIPTLLLSLVPTLTHASDSDDIPSGAKLCQPQGKGSCQFGVYQLYPGIDCYHQTMNSAYLFDHACNIIGHVENFTQGDAMTSQLPYTLDIENVFGYPSCYLKYEIAYSDGLYGYSMPSGGVWDDCEKGDDFLCTWYRVAFDCPGF
ncbi:uncharacterized protein AKAW2_60985A [Aspergillus luchuensis]|uniref:Uncharacterized protein n=2 Tax=Aspergillus subgen. Circumdati TaxID=2720871 RepID=A0A8G1R5J6_9EURO|nr:hypothetical protein BO85DRAFT_369419 [Aspergillus piperis CBS 112811]XP_041546483.1 uncharacterized protein AKAW2_60985A [Aspergillus luchuensis]GAA86589.1 similar to An12g06210 [Aspergillus luchuensis IFO 4308]RAH58902.1 hypothetical protein BO85DRAFT_369419 [Aspergillus piperis CBS 112811]BCS02721.1 hypothetical protein AKAW2_60985A [Aspergillus luchuensis]BCS14375.1 hypothetical protein ALUC_60931A [Aspergillus luchuensis]GAT30108.1 similar to An12g06210 [Aspergillus luchuensis]